MSGHLKGGHPTGVYLLGVKAYKRAMGMYLLGMKLIGVHLIGTHLIGVYLLISGAEVAPTPKLQPKLRPRSLVESNTFPIAIVDAQAPSYVPQIVMSSQGIA
jgi:hypothetical protein